MTDWARLLPVVTARQRRDAGALSVARAEVVRVEAALAALEAQSRTALAAAGAAAHAIGMTSLWQEDVRRRRAALLRNLALARARAGEAEARLRGSTRRSEGMAALAREQSEHRRRLELRRAEAEALDRLFLRGAAE